MNESLQAIATLTMILGALGSILAYLGDGWTAFVGLAALAAASAVALFWSIFRRDLVPDFLRSLPAEMYERDGFCFKILAKSIGAICYLDIHFQNRYERACHAVLAFQPSKSSFLKRPGLASFQVEIDCPPGGYGVTYVPWPVPKPYQGKIQSLDVVGNVSYPEGRGRLIRFRGGARMGIADSRNLVNIRTIADAILSVGGSMGWLIVFGRPAQVKNRLPTGVQEILDEDLTITTKVEWRLVEGTISAKKIKSMVNPEF